MTQSAKVGFFFLASVAAGYGIYKKLGGMASPEGTYVVHGDLRDATGLANHSRVTIAGISVGKIDAIRLENGKARIFVRIQNSVPLYEDATLGKKSASLLGESMIVLTPGGEGKRQLQDGDAISELNIVEAASTDQILKDVARIADRLKVVSEKLAGSIGTDEGEQNIKRILANVAEATEALNLTIRENRQNLYNTISNVENITAVGQPKIAEILDNIRQITGDLKTMLASQQGVGKDGKPGETKSGELRQTIERVNRASLSLESALSHADSIAAKIDRGEGTVGKLIHDDSIANDVQGVAEGVNDYVQSLTRLQAIVGLRSDYNFLANTLKNYVEIRLQPREDKYYVIELINDPRGSTSYKQEDVDTTNPNLPAHYRTVTTTTTDAFRFSVQFARRLNLFSNFAVTGRFGIKESTGGIGLDIHLLDNRFEIVQDMYGFGESSKPRYRLWLGYEFLSRLWLIGGIDHLFLADRRDYFMGLQLRFTDDDLKTLLPFAGSASAAGSR